MNERSLQLCEARCVIMSVQGQSNLEGHAPGTKKLSLPGGITADFYLLFLCDPPLIFCIPKELR